MTYHQIAEFQVEQNKLCMPFNVFHEAIEKTLGRPVFTHEFAFREELRKELYGEKESPTFEEICAYIPKEAINVECKDGIALMATEEFTKMFIK